MREIEFRGKQKDTGEWVYGYLREIWASVNEGERYLICQGKRFLNDSFTDMDETEIFPETVGQYTGLKDKNGVKIFEGDILESERNIPGTNFTKEKFREVVSFQNGHFTALQDYLFDRFVIGNIHDSPELLEGQECI